MKATFKKADDTYPHGSLREQPEMAEPRWNPETDKWINHLQEHSQYETYLRSLRVIPCSENNWKDGQELEEGKDYEINYSSENKGNGLLSGFKAKALYIINIKMNGSWGRIN